MGACGTLSAGSSWRAIHAIGSSGPLWSYWAGSTCSTWGAIGTIGTRCALWAGTIKCINKSIAIDIFRRKISLTIGVEIPAAKTRGTGRTLATLRTLGACGTLSAGSACGPIRAIGSSGALWSYWPGSTRSAIGSIGTGCALWPGTIKRINKSIAIDIFRWKIGLTIGVEIPAAKTRGTRRTLVTLRTLSTCGTLSAGSSWRAIHAIGSSGTGYALWAGTIECINQSIAIDIFRRKITLTIGVEIPAAKTRGTRRTLVTLRPWAPVTP